MAKPPERGPTGAPGGEGAKAAALARLHTLKKRGEFLATRKGARWATPHFVMEALKREAPAPSPSPAATPRAESGPRFGFTVSKKVGGAVERNRIKRRLKAAVQRTQNAHARPEFDYVLIARRPALDANFEALVSELVTAYARVHSGKRPSQGRGRRDA